MKKKMGRFHHVKKANPVKAKKRKKRVEKEEPALMTCDNCGGKMIRPTSIRESKLERTYKRLCSECSRNTSYAKPKLTMLTI